MSFIRKPNRKAKLLDALAVALLFIFMALVGAATLIVSLPSLGWLR